MTGKPPRVPTSQRHRPGRDRKTPFWMVMKRCIQIAAFVDLMFTILFYAAGSPLLAWINVASIAMYATAYFCLTRRKNLIALFLVWTEVLGHAALGTLMVGWDSAFHYYLLMFIPAIFVSTSTFKAATATLILWCFYVGLNALTYVVDPIEPLAPGAFIVLRYFNISVVFAMFAYLSSYYYRSIVAAHARLSAQASTDPLTGMFNRRHILELAQYESVRNERMPTQLSFIIGDIDFFKQVNDRYGHEGGDTVLVTVGTAIQASIREQDSAARWGGEEFLIVLPNTALEQALAVAERIRENVTALAIAVGTRTAMVNMTLGAACCRDGEAIGDAISRADQALYKGKNDGRNRVIAAP